MRGVQSARCPDPLVSSNPESRRGDHEVAPPALEEERRAASIYRPHFCRQQACRSAFGARSGRNERRYRPSHLSSCRLRTRRGQDLEAPPLHRPQVLQVCAPDQVGS